MYSLDKAKSKIPVNQKVGGVAASLYFMGAFSGSSSSLTNDSSLSISFKIKDNWVLF